MAINYTKLPDYNQFVQSYFVNQELLDTQDVGTVLVENANTQAAMANAVEFTPVGYATLLPQDDGAGG